MSWRSNQRSTGANIDPLGAPRRWGAPPSDRDRDRDRDHRDSRGREPERSSSSRTIEAAADPNAPRKRRSRWGDEKTDISGLPTAISSNIEGRELDNYATTLRLEEINRKLRTGDVIPNERERSVSPPPQYDGQGRRTNTRDIRYRKKLEDERTNLIEKAMKNDVNFRPPADYMMFKRGGRPSEKVYIPVKEFPEINFFGLLVGPRGNSLKKMERESGAKISIRGKGSVKDGKVKPDIYAGDENDDLHAFVVADTDDKVKKCVRMINNVIETAASTPENDNDHKRNQLRELAQLNGTLRDDEGQPCANCGKLGHRKWDCDQGKNFTANVVCHICGGVGHFARDCLRNKQKDPATGNAAFDNEYASLMAELGEDADKQNGQTAASKFAGNLPPWRMPENWQTPQAPTGQARAPYQHPGYVQAY